MTVYIYCTKSSSGRKVAGRSRIIADERDNNSGVAILLLNVVKVLVVGEFNTRLGLRVFILWLKKDDRASICDLGLCYDWCD